MTTTPTKAEFYTQAKYDLWLASKPDFSRITYFRAFDLPLVTALPDMPNVTYFRADNRLSAKLKAKAGAS